MWRPHIALPVNGVVQYTSMVLHDRRISFGGENSPQNSEKKFAKPEYKLWTSDFFSETVEIPWYISFEMDAS